MSEASWITALRAACDSSSQTTVATRIGYSSPVVNAVLRNKYKGDLSRVQRAVEGALMGAQVACPVLGEIPRNRCVEYQRGGESSHPMRVLLARTCPTCPNNLSAGRSAGKESPCV